MDNVLDVAQYIFEEYHEIYSYVLEETKLHKLLYFAQREHLAAMGDPMFAEPLEAWVHGPVCRAVRDAYTRDGISGGDSGRVSLANQSVATEVIYRYGESTASVLSEITHSETSWLNARNGLPAEQRSKNELSIDDIRADGARVFPYEDEDDDEEYTPEFIEEVLEISRQIKSGEMETYDLRDIALRV